MTTTARDLVRTKGGGIFSVTPDASVFDAMKMMAEANTGALLVIENGKVEGIVSERDCVRKVDLAGRTSREMKASEIMTHKVMYLTATQSLEEVMALMTEKSIRHMPVFDGETLLGVVSMRDVLRAVAHEQKLLISHLESYILNG